MTQDHNPFAPPVAHVEDVRLVEGPVDLAGRGTRLVAAIVDGLLGGGVYLLIAKITPLGPYFDRLVYESFFKFMFLSSAFGMLIFVALHAYTLDKYGQTLGKRLLGIRIVRPDGAKASLGRLLGLRYCVAMLPWMVPIIGPVYGLVDVLLIVRESRRCLHDLIADTVVVKA